MFNYSAKVLGMGYFGQGWVHFKTEDINIKLFLITCVSDHSILWKLSVSIFNFYVLGQFAKTWHAIISDAWDNILHVYLQSEVLYLISIFLLAIFPLMICIGSLYFRKSILCQALSMAIFLSAWNLCLEFITDLLEWVLHSYICHWKKNHSCNVFLMSLQSIKMSNYIIVIRTQNGIFVVRIMYIILPYF